MPVRAKHIFQMLHTKKKRFARLFGAGFIGMMCLLLASSGYDSGKRKIVIPPPPDLSNELLQRKPNIIVVLSEAFWDPTLIDSVRFSRDPLPFFHSLSNTYTSGWLLSPQFGGVTANVEFEVLTGNSIRFLSTGTVAYEKHVKTNIDSLASILSSQGYTATAISPFHNWFANSRETYGRFGFSRFISLEFFNPNEYEGPYIADNAVARRIMEESRRTEGPDFIFSNTMENHYHFYPNKFKRNTIHVSGNLPQGDAGILETYAQGINDADRMLETLVQYFSRLREPTIIVFFGDHLPYLEENYKVYRDTKYISGEDDPEFLGKMHKTPVLVWNNFSRVPRESIEISPSFLGPYVLNLAGLKGTPYTDYLYELSKRIPVIPPKEYYSSMNIQESDLSEYEAMQAFMLSGEATDQTRNTPVMGYGDPVISDFQPTAITVNKHFITDRGVSTVIVKGGPFGLGSRLFVDGKELQTDWRNEETLTAVMPKQFYTEPGSLELQVKVVDEKANILAQSSPVTILVNND